jgi:DNA invertase Pin-like site-specific DNA recombinase
LEAIPTLLRLEALLLLSRQFNNGGSCSGQGRWGFFPDGLFACAGTVGTIAETGITANVTTGANVMAKQKAVAYYRVSTAKQGASGLGLEAQQEAVRSYCSTGKWTMVDEVTEIESGKKNDRPALATALALCRVHGATLIIAKLDRLARNVHFISGLMESGVEFTAVDFPQANRLTVHILAAVAEHEAVLISQRTKAALAAAKARGVRLGNPTARIASQAARGALASAVVRSRNLLKLVPVFG